MKQVNLFFSSMTRRKQQRSIHVDNPEEGISSLNNAEMNNPNNEGNCSMEQESVSDIPPSFAEIKTPTTHPGASFQITKEVLISKISWITQTLIS
ncbi:hypothetical protein TNCT_173031 [Trichonephila clavata]|uniref:Uncharacterized protein n=1 Tax=Trichonephila clavata TaxID=2740835 RepID=A0A8X6GFC7_TRICU|nr:hypothetical protein TNCT_173031 [Trichonephila clavata]